MKVELWYVAKVLRMLLIVICFITWHDYIVIFRCGYLQTCLAGSTTRKLWNSRMRACCAIATDLYVGQARSDCPMTTLKR